MRRRHWIWIGVVLFIGLNALLVYIDDAGKVDRVAYINEWTGSYTTDMKKELEKPVVLGNTEEYPVYFDKNQGVIQEFLVSEEDDIQVGEGLFTYQVNNYHETESSLLNQLENLNGEAAAIQQAIQQMEMYQVSEDNYDLSSVVLITEEDIFIELPETSVEAELFKEQFLIEKEEELARKNTEIETVQSQLDELRVTGDTITFDSPYEGKVQHISKELMDPIVLIQGSELEVIGHLHEGERLEVEEGMPAELDLYETDGVLQSTVAEMAETPEDLDVNKTSMYPFTAALNEENSEELLPGLSGLLAITLEERNGITAVNDDAVVGQSVWKMNAAGKLQRTAVETGFTKGQAIEVDGEIEPGEMLAKDPEDNLLDGATFITPLILNEIMQETESTVDWKKPFFSGIISR